MPGNEKPVANPLVVLREEFDDWAVLFDPDSGNAFGLNPLGVFIWKLLDGHRTIEDIRRKFGRTAKTCRRRQSIISTSSSAV